MQDLQKLMDDKFIDTLILLYYVRCSEYRKACEDKDEENIKALGEDCSAFEAVAEVLGIDISIRNPYESYECCANCQHWDAVSVLGNDTIEPWSKMPEDEKRSIAYSGRCEKIRESIEPDENCSYKNIITEKEFCCNHYEKWRK
jgi:hypothetical protein